MGCLPIRALIILAPGLCVVRNPFPGITRRFTGYGLIRIGNVNGLRALLVLRLLLGLFVFDDTLVGMGHCSLLWMGRRWRRQILLPVPVHCLSISR